MTHSTNFGTFHVQRCNLICLALLLLGFAPALFSQIEVKPTAMPKTLAEASRYYWSKLVTKCGPDYYSAQHFPDSFVGSPRDVYWQMKNVKFGSESVPLTEADGLNGIASKTLERIEFTSSRVYSRVSKEPGSAMEEYQWLPWTPTPKVFYRIQLTLHSDGRWSFDYNPDPRLIDAKLHQAPTCLEVSKLKK